MGQIDIILLLEKEKKPLSRKEISDLLKERPQKITNLLKDLIDGKDICFIEIDRNEAQKKYGNNIKRRMRLYFLK